MPFRASLVSAILVLLLSSVACGGDPPNKEIQQARSAIDVARAAGAQRFAADGLTAAEEALKNANIAVEQRDYRLALNHALDSLEHAQTAAAQAAENEAAARTTADRAISAATAALESGRARLKTAEAAKAPAKALAAARTAANDAERSLQEARTAFVNRDYQIATTAASAVTQGIKAAFEALDAAPSPTNRRRR